jgi:FKBP-type peptidyl-prolyl cis-trans isomerase
MSLARAHAPAVSSRVNHARRRCVQPRRVAVTAVGKREVDASTSSTSNDINDTDVVVADAGFQRRRDVLTHAIVGMSGVLLARSPVARAAASESAGDWSSPGLASSGPAAQYVKTPSGLVYESVNEGVGEAAKPGELAVFEYVMRRANGYFIYGTIDCGIGCGDGTPAEYLLGSSGKLIPGLDELLTGMKPGEKKRALIKPELGYASDPKGLEPQPPEYGQRRQIERIAASNEPMIFEVKLVKTRPGR